MPIGCPPQNAPSDAAETAQHHPCIHDDEIEACLGLERANSRAVARPTPALAPVTTTIIARAQPDYVQRR